MTGATRRPAADRTHASCVVFKRKRSDGPTARSSALGILYTRSLTASYKGFPAPNRASTWVQPTSFKGPRALGVGPTPLGVAPPPAYAGYQP